MSDANTFLWLQEYTGFQDSFVNDTARKYFHRLRTHSPSVHPAGPMTWADCNWHRICPAYRYFSVDDG